MLIPIKHEQEQHQQYLRTLLDHHRAMLQCLNYFIFHATDKTLVKYATVTVQFQTELMPSKLNDFHGHEEYYSFPIHKGKKTISYASTHAILCLYLTVTDRVPIPPLGVRNPLVLQDLAHC